MRASLALHAGVVFVATAERTVHVRLFDLDGQPLEGGFDFDGRVGEAAHGAGAPDGIAVDDDRRIWIVDPALGAVRGFSLFGTEVQRLAPPAGEPRGSLAPDRAGVIGRPRSVAASGGAEDLALVVGSDGRRRHGLQVFGAGGHLERSLRPRGQSHGHFRGIECVAHAGERLLAVDRGNRAHVYRHFEHHFDTQLAPGSGAQVIEPRAAVQMGGGRFAVAYGGEHSSVELFDAAGSHSRTLIAGGGGSAEVSEPSGLALEWTGEERTSRLLVVDREGTRVRVFALDGRCYGAFEEALG